MIQAKGWLALLVPGATVGAARSLLASRGARGVATWNNLSFTRSRGCTPPLISPPRGTQCPTRSSRGHRFGGSICRRLCLIASRGAVDGESGIGVGAGGLGREIARLLRRERVPLVLHFDVNKTLIMVDPAGGKTQPQVLNGVLSEICWGYVEQDGEGSTWRWNGCPPSPDAPSLGTPMDGVSGKDSQLVTYSDFLHDVFADGEGRDNRRMKDARDEHKGSFTEEGQPGFGLRPEFLGLEQAMSLPQGVVGSKLAKEAGLTGKSSYIVPSFFECLLELKEAEADFGVVFRTFGSDIAGIAVEHNAFCEGRHPLFPGVIMDGRDGGVDYRVHLDGDDNCGRNVGVFYRDQEGVCLVMGTRDELHSIEQVRSAEKRGHAVYRSLSDIHNFLYEAVCPPPRTPLEARQSPDPRQVPPAATRDAGELGNIRGCDNGQRRCLALQDYYPFWRSRLEEAEAGKILPVDLSDDSKVRLVMFDDNIGRLGCAAGAHIVDVRDTATGGPVEFDVASKRFIVRAEPYLAIKDPGESNYFLVEVLRLLLFRIDGNGFIPSAPES